MPHKRLRRLCVLSIAATACAPADNWTAPPRTSLRTDVLGCWRLSGMDDEPTPDLVRLDSTVVTIDPEVGQRTVQRLDRLGHVILRDAEGNDYIDRWSADSSSDSIRLFLTGRYHFFGSHWVLAYAPSEERRDSLRGRSRAFTDVVRDDPYPMRSVAATRVDCPVVVE